MSNQTANYGLTLPTQEEYYNVDVFNDNNTAIDAEMKRISDRVGGLASVAASGSYTDLTNKPNLAAVATSGSYGDLTDKPNTGNGVTVYTINADTFLAGLRMDGAPYAEIHDCSHRVVYAGLLSQADKSSAESVNLRLYAASDAQGMIAVQIDDNVTFPTNGIKVAVVDLGAYTPTDGSGAVVINGI